MSAPLSLPHPERVATTNAWAFLRALRPLQRPGPVSWACLVAAVAADPAAALAQFRALAGPGPDARADLLLWADLRPDDVILLAAVPAAAWQAAEVAALRSTTEDPLTAAATTGATVLVLPATRLETASFPRPARADLAALRTVILLGGPASPAARARALAWIKPDLLLLGRAGSRFWGNPLDPVLAAPAPIGPLFPAPRRSRGETARAAPPS